MKKTTGKFLLLMRQVIPSARIRLLLGSWILASGLLSCSQNNKRSATQTDDDTTTHRDTAQVLCYDVAVDKTAVEDADPLIKPDPNLQDQKSGNQSCDSGAVKTCYACTKN